MNDRQGFGFPLIAICRDNEKPARQAKVHAFQAKGRPITNEEVDCATETLGAVPC